MSPGATPAASRLAERTRLVLGLASMWALLTMGACTGEVALATDRSGAGSDEEGGAGGPARGGSGGRSDGRPPPSGKPTVRDGCVVTGCNDQICSDRLVETDCGRRPQDACFETAICERGEVGRCGWRVTEELNACLADAAAMPPPSGPLPGSGMRGSGSGLGSPERDDGGGAGPGAGSPPGSGPVPAPGEGDGECRQTGCFGEVCADRDVESSCEWRNAFACFYLTRCERQPHGACEWTRTEEVERCIELSGALGGLGF
ncbi:MAG: hypothetical protein NZ898_12295 [Myxococcota bacterium]|nr:hypothetical protein [Myxococcota bacterium]MDW8363254.1 hypothetical protein [Myxococcales bacterium]